MLESAIRPLVRSFYIRKKYLLGVLILLVCGKMYAQNTDKTVSLFKDRSFRPAKATIKLLKEPNIKLESRKLHINYDTEVSPYPIPLSNTTLPAYKELDFVETHHNRQGFVRLGFGNYISPLLEAFISNKHASQTVYGFYAKHLSSFRGPIQNEKSAQHNTKLQLHTKTFLPKALFETHTQYKHDIVNFYGYTPSDTTKHVKQTFNRFSTSLNYRNPKTANKLLYDINLYVQYWSNRFRQRELEFAPEALVKWRLANDLTKHQFLGAKLETSFANSDKKGRYLLTINPFYEQIYKGLRFKVGGRLTYNNDSIQNKQAVFLYPDVSVRYAIIQTKLALYASLDGKTEKVFFNTLTQENPFLSKEVHIHHQNNAWATKLGVTGRWFSKIHIDIHGVYAKYNNAYFWNNKSDTPKQFELVYDDLKHVKLVGQVAWEKNVSKIILQTSWNNYNTKVLAEAWHKPVWENSLAISSRVLEQKLRLSTSILHLAGIKAQNPNTAQVERLSPIFDASIHANYYFTPTWNVFLEANNLFAQSYQRYLYYPVKRFNVLVGVMFSF